MRLHQVRYMQVMHLPPVYLPTSSEAESLDRKKYNKVLFWKI